VPTVYATSLFLKGLAFGFILAAGAARLRGRIGPSLMRAVSAVSGIAILGFAAWQIALLVR